jgi:hypothetical protein
MSPQITSIDAVLNWQYTFHTNYHITDEAGPSTLSVMGY